MIITRLKGGLGNQMFQYALGRRLALKNNDVLKLDTSAFNEVQAGETPRSYELSAFAIKGEVATVEEIKKSRYPLGIFSKLMEITEQKILRRHHTRFEPHILSKTGTIYLNGYWQSPRYFEEIRDTLLKDFTLAKPLSKEAEAFGAKIRSKNAASLHVRRGDYIANTKVRDLYGPCTIPYFERSIREMEMGAGDVSWFVFSDDIKWAKDSLPLPASAVYIAGKALTAAEELHLMSLCKHNVIANSTFSFWGAWLNINPNKVVIAPRPWFDYAPTFNDDIIPDTWTQIPKN